MNKNDETKIHDLRDQFAMAALQGILASTTENHSYGSFEDASDAAYRYANAMLISRANTRLPTGTDAWVSFFNRTGSNPTRRQPSV